MIHERLPRKVFWSCGQLQNLCPDIPCSSWLVIKLKNYHTGGRHGKQLLQIDFWFLTWDRHHKKRGRWFTIANSSGNHFSSALTFANRFDQRRGIHLPLLRMDASILGKKKKKQHHVSFMSQRSGKESNQSKNAAVNMWGRKANNIKYEASAARRKDSAANQAAACNFWSC